MRRWEPMGVSGRAARICFTGQSRREVFHFLEFSPRNVFPRTSTN
jgi:hypothetical protein